jgi:hypothetical protein
MSQLTSSTRSASIAVRLRPAPHLHAVHLQVLAHGRGEEGVVAQQKVLGAFQQGHAQAVAAQRIGDFHSDVSAPDHHRALGLPLAQKRAHPFAIVQGVQRENVRLRGPLDSRRVATRTRRDHQLVVRHPYARFQLHFAPRVRDRDHPRAGAHVDLPLLAKVLGRIDRKLACLAHAPFHEIRQPARSEGDRRTLFQDDDFQARIDPPRARGRAQPRGDTPDDH